ncbi:MAG: ISNCY family transposase [Acidobacteria bacterium]|nr:ISNCY family transposase [Acidobacteriota bacterium]
MKETVTLNQKEQGRAKVLLIVMEGRCTHHEAAESLGLSERQLRRLKQRFRSEGPAALAHGNRGRKPVRAISAAVRAELVKRVKADYADYNHTHLHEQLVEEHGLALSRRSLTRILSAAGLRSPKRRRPRQHRSRRERRAQEGMLLQVDGSQHDWLEGRGPRLVLIGGIDDATGDVPYTLFREHEDGHGYLLLLRELARTRGIPAAWYSDRHSIFQRNDKEPWTIEEQLAGRREPTQIARALEQLGITLIPAHSPQAKGRIERLWGTFQDRLVKELRRAGASTLEEANAVLCGYLPCYRARFARAAADPEVVYRPLPKGLDLDGICSFHYVRTVANDNTVRLEERLVQVPPGPGGRSYAGCRVEVQERLDGSLAVVYQGNMIAVQPGSGSAVTLRARGRHRGGERPSVASRRAAPKSAPQPPKNRETAANGQQRKPAADHPWRRAISGGRTKSLAS